MGTTSAIYMALSLVRSHWVWHYGNAHSLIDMAHTKPAWDAWYKTYRWQQLRRRQLEREPLCAMCQADGRVTAATICDHVEPHRGDAALFWSGPFQSLCKPHHD